MQFDKPIAWEQGLLLQPQHLEYTDLHHHNLLVEHLRMQNPYFWGVYACEYDRTLLENNVFSLVSATIVLPDGALLKIPQNAKLSPRSFGDILKQKIDSFKVYLGVKQLLPLEANVTEKNTNDASETNTRFLVEPNSVDTPDVYFKGPNANIKQLKFAVRLFWETESAQVQNYVLIPIARIVRNAADIYLDEQFIPPSIRINSSANLAKVVRVFSEQLTDRVKQMESLKYGANFYENQSNNQTKLLILQSLARSVPQLMHILDADIVHPLALYQVLISLLGELSIFSTDISILGENQQGDKLLPSYDHDNLQECFSKTFTLVLTTLNQIVLGSEYLIKARKEDNLYIANPAENFFANKLHFYLLVQVPKDALDTVLENINTTAKLCAYSDMRKYLEYALPGISLKKLTAVPQGIPRISDCLYFQIDKSSQDWGRLEKEGSIAFYVGNITTELSISFAGTKD